MNALFTITVLVNFACMTAAIWLAIYVISRSPRSAVTWLTGLTLLSVSGWFLNVLLAVDPPPLPVSFPGWLRPFFWIWPAGSFEDGWGGWMQGWQVTPAIMFWHHATMLMRPGRMNAWRWTRVLAGYGIAATAIYVQLNTNLMFTEGLGDPLYLNTLQQGRLYPLFMGFLFLFTVLSLVNLLRSAKIAPGRMPRRQLNILASATLTAGLSGPTAFIAFLFELPLPRVILSVLLGSAVLLMGFGVARYSALVERRIMGRDLLYNSAATLLVVTVYLALGWVLMLAYNIPMAALAFIVVLSIYTHSLVDVGRHILDLVFFRREVREFRSSVRNLISATRDPQALEENLSQTFQSLCESVRAGYGLVLLFEDRVAHPRVMFHWTRGDVPLPAASFVLDDAVQPEAGQYSAPLQDVSLLIPIYAGGEQTGVMLFGPPDTALRFAQDDIEHLLELSDHISNVIQAMQREYESLSRLHELARTQQSALENDVEWVPVKVVEDALRNLHEYSYLGKSPLAELEQVTARLAPGPATHLDRGREVHNLLLAALEKLRPAGEPPRDPIAREWYPYLILCDAYVNEVQNREIMGRLYISEGTFNRTRRTAIRALARTLAEMEYSR